jgi:hypothetical protein
LEIYSVRPLIPLTGRIRSDKIPLMKGILHGLLGFVLLVAPALMQAQYTCTTNADNTLTIANYTGSGGAVTIPTNINGLTVTIIGDDAFMDCDQLTGITIPNGITDIGVRAFWGCINLTDVSIPTSVTNIGSDPFGGCISLPAIAVDAQNSLYVGTNGVLFNKSQTTLIQYPGGMPGGYTIPGSVTNIGAFAFQDCYHLTSVTFPGSLTTIGTYAFYACYGPSSITIPGSVTNIGDFAFAAAGLTSAFFQGNAPIVDSTVFDYDGGTTVYYLPGMDGWDDFSAESGLQAVLWNPLIQTGDGSFGVRSNQFGFNITGTTNIPIVVEACTNLSSPVWTPLQTLNLTNGTFYFSEPLQTNNAGRFYRISSA